MAGYTADNPPRYIRPLLEQYDELEVDSCGYKSGSWVEFKDTDAGVSGKLERAITYDVDVTYNGRRRQISTGVSNGSFNNVAERDELIGNELIEKLGGYNTFAEAIEDQLGISV